MILSGHQPVYLPSMHLFNKIALSDKFMFVGHCQFVNKSWHSRNRIRNGNDVMTLTVPVLKSGRFGQAITDTVINGDHWKRKHLASIRGAYQNRPYFNDYFPVLAEIITKPWVNLGELNIALILKFLEWLKIDVPILYSEDLDITGQKTDMLISMCQVMKAERYLSNEGSRIYVDERKMSDLEICHCWQDFNSPIYDQGGNFIPDLSIIDCLFNIGPAAGDLVRKSGSILPGKFSA